jgi:hypothetical protein
MFFLSLFTLYIYMLIHAIDQYHCSIHLTWTRILTKKKLSSFFDMFLRIKKLPYEAARFNYIIMIFYRTIR